VQTESAAQQVTAPRVRRTSAQPLSAIDIPDALLTVATISAVTGLSATSIYRLAQRGELIPARRGNRCTRWRAADVRAWLAAQAAAPQGNRSRTTAQLQG